MTSLLGKYIKLKNKLQNSGMEQFLRKLVFCPNIRYCGSKTRILLDGFPLEGYQSIIPSCTPQRKRDTIFAGHLTPATLSTEPHSWMEIVITISGKWCWLTTGTRESRRMYFCSLKITTLLMGFSWWATMTRPQVQLIDAASPWRGGRFFARTHFRNRYRLEV